MYVCNWNISGGMALNPARVEVLTSNCEAVIPFGLNGGPAYLLQSTIILTPCLNAYGEIHIWMSIESGDHL